MDAQKHTSAASDLPGIWFRLLLHPSNKLRLLWAFPKSLDAYRAGQLGDASAWDEAAGRPIPDELLDDEPRTWLCAVPFGYIVVEVLEIRH